MPAIRIGVAGWDYPDWEGPVYAPARGRRPDRLTYLARYIDVVEVNSTFYRPVAPRIAETWLRRTPPTLVFTAKAHRSLTHEATLDPEGATPTLGGLAPLREAGRLRALLLQFPQSFRYSAAARARLEVLCRATAGWPVVIEVRHAGWQSAAARDWFGTLGAGWCVVDQPRIGARTATADPRVVGRLAYLRLHGRNAAEWFRENGGRDARYDYLYGAAELAALADTARAMAAQAEELIVIQNNHFRGQALVNALQMKHRLTGERPLAPARLAEAYPGLADEVRLERDRLF